MNKEQIEAGARAIFNVRDDEFDMDEWEDLGATERERYECDARAAYAAFHPTITTAEELDALPDRSVVRDGDGCILEKDEHAYTSGAPAWYAAGVEEVVAAEDITLPATVLHMGARERD